MQSADADNALGAWSAVFDWPLIAIHAVLTPDGRVMSYGSDQTGMGTGYFVYDLWDPSAGPTSSGHATLPNTTNTDLFCSSQLVLPTGGDIFIGGGDTFVDGHVTHIGNNNSNLFDYAVNTLARGNDMNRQRWYSTATALLNGEIYIQGGSGGEDLPEIRGLDGTFRLLTGADTNGINASYPRNFIASDGRVFGFGKGGNWYYVDVTGNGSVTRMGSFPSANAGNGSAAMFRPGRVLQIGGNSNGALIIDVNGLTTPLTALSGNMSSQRQWVNATVLADGRVLGTGGSEVDNELIGVNNSAEVWNPATGTWLVGPSGVNPRLYHSNALLLPDGSVLVSGGGAGGPVDNLNAEIYYPSYLYDASGAFATRPTITTGPATIDIGTHFSLTTGGPGTIKRVTLVKTGSVTHSFNMDQRFIELYYAANGNQLDVMAPARAGDAPPGYYLLFVINDQNVPSMGKIVRMNVAANPNPPADHTPTIGGLGGTRYGLACNANETLVGIAGRSGSYVDQVGPQCVRLDSTGHWIGDPVTRGSAGGTGGNAYTKTCARDSAVSGFRGRGFQYVDQLDVECKALDASGRTTGSGTYLGAVGGTGGAAQGPYGCGTGNPAFAIHGTALSTYVDGFAIQCRQGVINAPPSIVNPGAQSGRVGTAVDLAISASDPNGDALTYTASGLPAGLSINAGTGHITGTPTTATSYTVTVRVSDGSLQANARFSWTILPPDSPPNLVNPGNQSSVQGTPVSLGLSASDPNGDTLTFSASGLPTGLGIQPSTGLITGTPTVTGVYNVTATVSDGTSTDSESFTWTITGGNVAPVVTNPGDQSGTVGAAVDLAIVASDPNPGDTLTYSASGLPAGLGINGSTGHITGTPTISGLNDNVRVTVSDGIASGSASFRWTIFPTGAFTLDPLPAMTPRLANTSITFTASAHNGVNTRYKWYFDDGTPETPYSSSPSITHSFAGGGVYFITVTAVDERNSELVQGAVQAIYLPPTANRPAVSGNIAYSQAGGNNRLWVVNQDNNSVSVFNANSNVRIKQVSVGTAPRSLAISPSGEIWVTSKEQTKISVIDPGTNTVVRTINLPNASQPFGIAFSPAGDHAYVALEGSGKLLQLNPATGAQTGSADVGPHPRHIAITHDGRTIYVSRFVTPLLPGEDTGLVHPDGAGGDVLAVDAASMSVRRTIVLQYSDKPDFENEGSGVPNYLGAAVISPDGTQAWVPSKQDNIERGMLRNGLDLNFQNTVRAISSRIDLANETEDFSARVDHDNAGVASAAVFDRYGIYLFVALETSREVAVVDAFGHFEIFRFQVGRAPQGLAISPDGLRLYVNNFMDRSVGVYDLAPLINGGTFSVNPLATLAPITTEKLDPQVLVGKQLFYDARDTRLARDRYISCAACHDDGGLDGRVWDTTGFGEGLRNTIQLRGRAAMGQGFLHWSSNFDELQDFEGQIRALSGGTGLMADADFYAGTRSEPLGDPKAGLSPDLDALAAYVASLNKFASSPLRNSDGTLTSDAVAGKTVFTNANCGSCHSGAAFTDSAADIFHDIGTIKPSSGYRLYGPLTGIDTPTLRDVWATAPYLHDGSAATISDAVQDHDNVSLTSQELAQVVAYVGQIGGQESSAPLPVGSGLGVVGAYYNTSNFSGAIVKQRTERINFTWPDVPAPGVVADQFSVRWQGRIEAPVSGSYVFQADSDEGIRVWVNGQLVINHFNAHTLATDTSAAIRLTAGTKYDIRVDLYDLTGQAVAILRWKIPGYTNFAVVPKDRLYTN
jgi:YVTN family beta-propeller protein